MSESAFLREQFVNFFTEVQEVSFLAYECSEFYREKLRRAKLQPEEIRSITDFSRLPPTTREEIQGRPWSLLTVPKSRICQIDASTPSSKLPRIYIPLSDDDLYRGGLRPFMRGTTFSPPLPMTVSEKDLLINALPYEARYLGLLFNRILQDGVGAGLVPVGKGGFYSIPEKSLRIMKDLGGDHLFATPAYIVKEALRRLRSSKIIFGSEFPLYHPQVELEKIRVLLKGGDFERATGKNILAMLPS